MVALSKIILFVRSTLLFGLSISIRFAAARNQSVNVDGVDTLTVCPGELISITCNHDNVDGEQTRWVVRGAEDCEAIVSHASGTEQDCGPFTITMISNISGATVSSTAQTAVNEALNGSVVDCFAGGLSSSPPVGNVIVNLLEIPNNFSWSAYLRTNMEGSRIEWNQPTFTDYQQCITGYSISWNQTEYNTTDDSNSVSGVTLHQLGFPYCESQLVTVTPLTLQGPVTLQESAQAANITLISSDFNVVDDLMVNYVLQDTGLEMHLSMQEQSSTTLLSEWLYGVGLNCTPSTPFSGNSVSLPLPGAKAGDSHTVCLMYRYKDCVSTHSTSASVPPTNLITSGVQQSGKNYTINMMLPLTRFPSSDLLILSSISPSANPPLAVPFPSSTYQYTVTFTDLSPGTEYTYTIRVVLVSDNTTDATTPVSDSFMLKSVEAPGVQTPTTQTLIIICVVAPLALILLIVIIIAIVAVMCVLHRRKRCRTITSTFDIAKETPNFFEESDYAVPQDLKLAVKGHQTAYSNQEGNRNSTTPATQYPEGIYSSPFDALPNGHKRQRISGSK